MTDYVLDTNIVARLMRGDEGPSTRLKAVPRNAVFVPQPVIAEMEYGLDRLGKTARSRRLRARFELVRREIRSARWTYDVSRAFGTIKADLERRGLRLEDFDVAIAAHALATRRCLVSGNLKHMRRVRGLQLEAW